MNYQIIATGSTGNAVLLDGGLILIDCGVSYKKLAEVLPGVRLILMTHQHGDHCNKKTVARIAQERPLIRWACCEWMVPILRDCGVEASRIDRIAEGMALDYPNLARVRPERVHHDVPNCCWHIDIGGHKCFYVTDTGHLQGIEAKGYELYLIEANHGTEEIKLRAAQKQARGEFAYELRARENHLSFEQANEWLVNQAADYSRICYLHQHKDRED